MANRPSRKVVIEIDPEIERLLASIPDTRVGASRRQFTPQQDKLILAGWEKKDKRALAALVGCHETTMRKRYRELKAVDEST